jgi:2'-5' RNA ligase
MLASIWLQLPPPQGAALADAIASVARAQRSVVFPPHLTVCGGEMDPATWDEAAKYVRQCNAIPIAVRARTIAHLRGSPFRAVFVELEDHPALKRFREELRAITRAGELHLAHISLFYTLDEKTQAPIPDVSEESLRAIAEECARLVQFQEYRLERPVIVSPEGSWENVRSWKVVRELPVGER